MNDFKIGLTFSGGGFRASAFNLGVLSYLETLTLANTSLLNHVVALSTVSGGTVTGARYAISIKEGESFPAFFHALYDFMKNTDLVSLALERLTSEKGWENGRVKSLINAFADVYDTALFAEAKFGTLLTDNNPIHLKHISFNATEFSNALQFRFQWSEKVNAAAGEPDRGIIGNTYYRIPEAAAKEIRMADILAASSCFPGGFEPINFPSDFIYSGAKALPELNTMPGYPVGLMDGGIVDNQGIEPILLAERRMSRNMPGTETENAFDLIIISDVASPFMEGYKQSTQKPDRGWRALTPAFILSVNTIVLLGSLAGMVYSYRHGYGLALIGSTFLSTCSLIVYAVGGLLKSLPLRLQVPKSFLKPLGKLLRLRLRIYETMISNRADSVLKMVSSVFLKHVRRLNYKRIYEDSRWENRRITNVIYELTPEGSEKIKRKIADRTIPADYLPGSAITQVAGRAAAMGTTLWFTKEEIENGMLDDLIACGQFTICWNLLDYLGRLDANATNTHEGHAALGVLKTQLLKDWLKFQANPHFLVKAYQLKAAATGAPVAADSFATA